MTSQKNICVQNKLKCVLFFFSKGFNSRGCERNCDTAGVLGMLKQNFSFLASYVIVISMLQKTPLK